MNSDRIYFDRQQVVDMLVLVFLTSVVYGSSLGHDFQRIFDDNWYVLYNDAIREVSWDNLRKAFADFYVGHYLPIQIVSYMLDYSLWGLAPGGYHLTNLVIHAANGLLIYRLFSNWYGERLFALVGAAVFLVHPVQVETVAWISQRKSLLSMFFFLLAWEGYRCYREAETRHAGYAYAASLIMYAFSLLSKVMTIVFPLILIAYYNCFYPQKSRFWKKEKIPFFLLAGIIACVNIYSQNSEKGVGAGGRAVYHGGSPWATFLTMLPVFCRYLGMLVWPSGLSPEYAPVIHKTVDAGVLVAALVLSCVAMLAVFMYRHDRRLGFWVFFFWIGLLPVANIIPMIFLMQDHYLYLPMIAVAAFAGEAALWLKERSEAGRQKLLLFLPALLLLALGFASTQRLAAWRNDFTLWSDAVVTEPASSKAWECYGDVLRSKGQIAAARSAYERGLALAPDSADVLARLGDLYTEEGELEKGLALLLKLLELKPSYVTGWASLGNNYLRRGNYSEAEMAYKRAQSLQPEAWQTLSLLGNLALIQDNFEIARYYYMRVESLVEGNAENAYNLTCVESRAGNPDVAVSWLAVALERGYEDSAKLQSDKRLSLLWNNPVFIKLLHQYDVAQ